MPPTVRSLARSLGLSPATISNALGGRGRVSSKTLRRVQEAARAAGYWRNPLAGNLMSELRRSRSGTFHGVLAALELLEPERPPHGPFHHEILAGARAKASELGYELQEFAVGQALTLARLDSILLARGISGILLLPKWRSPDTTALSWQRYAGVYTDCNEGEPCLHCVCCNHYCSMLHVLERLWRLGYRRPGLCVEADRDGHVLRRWSAAFWAFQQSRPSEGLPPPLFAARGEQDRFAAWFAENRPDVVLSPFTDALDWLEAAGVRVPEACGFFCLNLLYGSRVTAGLDRHPRELGRRSVESLVALVQRSEFGAPKNPTSMTLSASWVDGPTLLDRSGGSDAPTGVLSLGA